MVANQIMARGVKDKNVIGAMLKVERHLFVPAEFRSQSYGDFPLPIGEGQTISQPYMVALMTELLDVSKSHKVLEIGTGSAYQAAILAELAGTVCTVERHEILAVRAAELLERLKFTNVTVITGDGSMGYAKYAPYDRIMVTASAGELPMPLFEQLREGGKLLIPLGGKFSQGLTVIEKKNGKMRKETACGCVFVPLIGRHGHREEE